MDFLVGWEINKDPGSSPGCGGGAGARQGWLLLLERFSCWVLNETSHTILFKNPDTRHRFRERKRERKCDNESGSWF